MTTFIGQVYASPLGNTLKIIDRSHDAVGLLLETVDGDRFWDESGCFDSEGKFSDYALLTEQQCALSSALSMPRETYEPAVSSDLGHVVSTARASIGLSVSKGYHLSTPA